MRTLRTWASSVGESLSRTLAALDWLLLRLMALFFVALVVSILLTVAGLINVAVEAWIFNIAAVAGAGIVLGFSARALFRGHTMLLKWMASLVALLAVLLLMGAFTWGYLGIAFPSLQRPQPYWGTIGEMILGSLAITLSLAAWRPRTPEAEAVTEPVPVRNNHAATGARLVATPVAPAPKKALSMFARMRNGFRALKTRGRNNDIRLVGSVEHRCPYCLQAIEDRDPRGVVTCPVCHTRHHRDCWAITGMCQVPHYHA